MDEGKFLVKKIKIIIIVLLTLYCYLAHNIEDSSRDAGSFEVDELMLRVISKELNQIIINGYEAEAHGTLEMVVDQMFDWITSSENEFTIKEYETHHRK